MNYIHRIQYIIPVILMAPRGRIGLVCNLCTSYTSLGLVCFFTLISSLFVFSYRFFLPRCIIRPLGVVLAVSDSGVDLWSLCHYSRLDLGHDCRFWD